MSEWIILGFVLLVIVAIAGGVAAVVVVVSRSNRQRPAAYQPPPPYVSNAIPAGWYDDGNGAIRWYDGQRWTPHTR